MESINLNADITMSKQTKIPNIANHKPNNIHFKLPTNESSRLPPPVIQKGLYTWELEPLVEGVLRYILVTCTKCSKIYQETWPIKSTNLHRHWEVHHPEDLRNLHANEKNSGVLCEISKEPIEILEKSEALTSFLDYLASGGGSAERISTYLAQTETEAFDPGVYKCLLFGYLAANNLPFALAESPYLTNLINFARRYKEDIPPPSPQSLKLAFDEKYQKSSKSLKLELTKHRGRFAITLHIWNSNENHEFLGIILNYHNEDFVLKKIIIGYEPLTNESSDLGDEMFQHLYRVLSEHGIEDRIISITRPNGIHFNTMMDKSKEILPKIRYGAQFIGNINGLDIEDSEAEGSDDSSFFVNKDPKPEFLGDICCFDNVLTLTVKAFFSCTLFITSKSEVLSELSKIKTEGNLDLKDIVRHMEEAPKIMASIINATHNNVYIKEMFRYLVKARKKKPENEPCPETLLQYNYTQWPSVYEALKRFLYFRPEVTKLLKRIRRQAPKERDSFKLKVFHIDEFTWDYLSFLRDILEVFFEPLMILQHDTRKTNHMTIPYVWKIVKELDELKSNVISQRNPFISLGLEKASKMILEYYPIRDSNIAPLKNLYLATMLDPRMKRGFFANLQLPTSVVTAAEEYRITCL